MEQELLSKKDKNKRKTMFKIVRQSKRYCLKRVLGSTLYFIQDKENDKTTAMFQQKTELWKKIRYPNLCNNKDFDVYCSTAFDLQTTDFNEINLILS
jgi:hypothetical protein